MPEQAFISIGSNIEPEHYLPLAVEALKRVGSVARVSKVYQSKAVGPAPQPDFLNAAALVETSLTAAEVRKRLREIEEELGRQRETDKFAPRTIDLDLCLCGDTVIDTPELTLPHPEVTEHTYVAVPLAELAPTLRHPVTGESLYDLGRRLVNVEALTHRPDVVL